VSTKPSWATSWEVGGPKYRDAVARLLQVVRRKSRVPVVHIEGDPGLRRGESVGDLGVRIRITQLIEQALIRHLSRQAHILGP
jgi:hypothetical protein